MSLFKFTTLTDVTGQMSGEVMLMTRSGGIATMIGPVVGAALVVTLQNSLATSPMSVTVITGVIVMVCVLLCCGGILGELCALRLGDSSASSWKAKAA